MAYCLLSDSQKDDTYFFLFPSLCAWIKTRGQVQMVLPICFHSWHVWLHTTNEYAGALINRYNTASRKQYVSRISFSTAKRTPARPDFSGFYPRYMIFLSPHRDTIIFLCPLCLPVLSYVTCSLSPICPSTVLHIFAVFTSKILHGYKE